MQVNYLHVQLVAMQGFISLAPGELVRRHVALHTVDLLIGVYSGDIAAAPLSGALAMFLFKKSKLIPIVFP